MANIDENSIIIDFLYKTNQTSVSKDIEVLQNKLKELNLEKEKFNKSGDFNFIKNTGSIAKVEAELNNLLLGLNEVAKGFQTLGLSYSSIGAKMSKKLFNESDSEYIKRLQSEIKQIAPTYNATVKSITTDSATIEQAFTGIGRKITTVMDNATNDILELSEAGKNIFKNMSPEAAMKKYSELSTMTLKSFQDKTGKELLKLDMSEGIRNETNKVDLAMKTLLEKIKVGDKNTLQELQNAANEMGAKFVLGDIIYAKGKAIAANYEFIISDTQKFAGTMKAYTTELNGIKYNAFSIGEGTGQVVTTNPYTILEKSIQNYATQLQTTLQLEKQLQQAELSGNTNTANIIKQKIIDNNTLIAQTQQRIEQDNNILALNSQYQAVKQNHAGILLNNSALQQDIKEGEQISKLIGLYQAYGRAKINAYTVAQDKKSSNTTVRDAEVQKQQALNTYMNALKTAKPELLKNAKYTEGMTQAEKDLRVALDNANNSTKANGFSLKSLGQQIVVTARNVLEYQLAWKAIGLVTRSIRESITLVKELDTAMTNVRVVTGQTSEQALKTINTYAELGKQLGATARQVTEGSIEWLRQGNTIKETSKLLESSTKLSKLGMIDAATSTELMTATLNGFNLKAQDSESIVDKLVKVDLDYATSAQEIATALQYTAASAGMANVSLDEMIGMITVVSATTRRSAESIGQSFKTIFSRLQNVSAGKDLDDEGEKLNDVEKRLNSLGIKLRDSVDEWRDVSDILDEVGNRWESFTSIEKSAISTALAGTRQRENLIITFNNWDEVLKATSKSQNSAGTSAEKYAVVMESIQAKINTFIATWEKLVNNLNQSGTFKGLVDLGTTILVIIDKFNILGNLMKGGLILGGFALINKSIKGIGVSVGVLTKLATAMTAVNNAQRVIGMTETVYIQNRKNATLSLQGLTMQEQALIINRSNLDLATKKAIASEMNLAVAQDGTVLSTTNLTTVTQHQILQELLLASANKQAILNKLGLTLSTDQQLSSTANLTRAQMLELIQTNLLTDAERNRIISLYSLTEAEIAASAGSNSLNFSFKALLSTMKALVLTNPLSFLLLLATLAPLVSKGIKLLNGDLEAQTKKLDDLNSKYNETTSKLESLQSEYDSVIEKVEKLNEIENKTPEENYRLKELQKTTFELENQISLQKELVAVEKSNLAETTKKALEAKSYWSETVNNADQSGISKVTLSEAITSNVKDIDAYKNTILSLEKSIKNLEKANETGTIEYKMLNGQLKNNKKELLDLNTETADYVATLTEMVSKLDLTVPAQKTLYDNVMQSANAFAYISDPINFFSDRLNALSGLLDENGNRTAEYKAQLQSLITFLSTQTNGFDIFKDVLTDDEIKLVEEYYNAVDDGKTPTEDMINATDKLNLSLNNQIKSLNDLKTSAEGYNDSLEEETNFGDILEGHINKINDLKEAQTELSNNNKLADKTLISLMKSYPELTDVMTRYLNGYIDEKQLLGELNTAYDESVQVYKDALTQKMESDTAFYSESIAKNEELTNTLLTNYGIDVNNYATTEALKTGIVEKIGASIVSNDNDRIKQLADGYVDDLSNFGKNEAAKAQLFAKVQTQIANINSINAGASLDQLKRQSERLTTANEGDEKKGQRKNPVNAAYLDDLNVTIKAMQLEERKAKEAQKLVDSYVSQLLSDIKLPTSSETSGASGASGSSSKKDEKDPWIEEFEKRKKELDDLLATDQITNKQYFDSLTALNNKYYKGNIKYIEEYKEELIGLWDLQKTIKEEERQNVEEQIEILATQPNTEKERLALLRKNQESLHQEAQEARKMGVAENGEYIKSLQSQYRDYTQDIKDLTEEMFDNQIEFSERYIDLNNAKDTWGSDTQIKATQRVLNNIEQFYLENKDLYDNDANLYKQYVDAKISWEENLTSAIEEELEKRLTATDNLLEELQLKNQLSSEEEIRLTRNKYAILNAIQEEYGLSQEKYAEERLKIVKEEQSALEKAFEKAKKINEASIERQIKDLEKQKDTQNDEYDDKIDKIQDAINAMDEEAEKENKLLAIEKAREALAKVKEQKTAQIYREGIGFVYESDPEALKGAQSDLDKLLKEWNNYQKKLDLEQQVKDFKKAKEENAKNIDAEIDKLKELKEAWSNSLDLMEEFDEYDDFLKDLFDDESKSFEERLQLVKNFTEAYKKSLGEIGSAQADLANGLMPNTKKSQSKTWYVEKGGESPKDAQIGDKVVTTAGTYQIVEQGTKDKYGNLAKFNEETNRWSIKIDDISQVIDDAKFGTEKLTDKIEKEIDASKKHKDAINKQTDVTKEDIESTEYNSATNEQNALSTDLNKESTDINSDKEIENTSALENLTQTIANTDFSSNKDIIEKEEDLLGAMSEQDKQLLENIQKEYNYQKDHGANQSLLDQLHNMAEDIRNKYRSDVEEKEKGGGGGTSTGGYAYFDKGGTLHVVKDAETAKQYSANGQYTKTDIENKSGYPVAPNSKGEKQEAIVYDKGNGQYDTYLNGNQGDNKPSGNASKEINDLYNSLNKNNKGTKENINSSNKNSEVIDKNSGIHADGNKLAEQNIDTTKQSIDTSKENTSLLGNAANNLVSGISNFTSSLSRLSSGSGGSSGGGGYSGSNSGGGGNNLGSTIGGALGSAFGGAFGGISGSIAGGKIGSSIGGSFGKSSSKHSSGVMSSNAERAIVDEYGEEFIIRPPQYGRETYLEKGSGVIPADITRTLSKFGANPNEYLDREFIQRMTMLQYSKSDNNDNPIILSIGDINLQGVQNVSSLSKAIVNLLPNQIITDLFKKS